jgi:thiol:disulfide interchange protein
MKSRYFKRDFQLIVMRSLVSVFLLFACLFAYAQNATDVQWSITSKKNADNSYELKAKATVAAGKYLYLWSKGAEGLDSIRFEFTDSSIQKISAVASSSSAKDYNDPLFDNKAVLIAENEITITQTIRFSQTVPETLKGKIVFATGAKDEFLPGEHEFEVKMEGGVSQKARIKIASIDINKPQENCGDEGTEGKSLWGIFILGLLGGFIALLTPCVFPLIPLTVSFFTKRSGSRGKGVRNAILYGVFIFLIYVLLSLPFHLLDQTDPEILNNISTNVWLNIIFFIIFVVFAISFFGYFEITLPGNLASGADSKAGVTSFIGIFFMALTLAIVSFSCTGPILGSLLAGALTKDGGAMQLSFGMGGFGLGLALPFALFAMFPNWLQSLPKSGGWLNTVKVVLGFLELAMAVKFLSNADLVMQWKLLPREVFVAIWIIIGTLTVLYLLGLIKFPHDDKKVKIGPIRWTTIILFAAITVYLIPGLTNTKWAQLKLLSGMPPPFTYSLYHKDVFEPLRDYEQALALARKENKPLLIDFTGWACVNCRRMEENVWTDPEVLQLMKDEFIVVSLYVDERKVLPAAQQQTYTTKTGGSKQIITVGDKWATFQSENFNAVAQPQYAILSLDEKALTKTKAYTPDPKEFKEWLECGLKAFSNK